MGPESYADTKNSTAQLGRGSPFPPRTNNKYKTEFPYHNEECRNINKASSPVPGAQGLPKTEASPGQENISCHTMSLALSNKTSTVEDRGVAVRETPFCGVSTQRTVKRLGGSRNTRRNSLAPQTHNKKMVMASYC